MWQSVYTPTGNRGPVRASRMACQCDIALSVHTHGTVEADYTIASAGPLVVASHLVESGVSPASARRVAMWR